MEDEENTFLREIPILEENLYGDPAGVCDRSALIMTNRLFLSHESLGSGRVLHDNIERVPSQGKVFLRAKTNSTTNLIGFLVERKKLHNNGCSKDSCEDLSVKFSCCRRVIGVTT